jgi:hypothetical protein
VINTTLSKAWFTHLRSQLIQLPAVDANAARTLLTNTLSQVDGGKPRWIKHGPDQSAVTLSTFVAAELARMVSEREDGTSEVGAVMGANSVQRIHVLTSATNRAEFVAE